MKKIYLLTVLLFVIFFTINAQPLPFSLVSPNNGSYVNALPTFNWQSSSGATSYQLWIDGLLKKDNLTTTNYSIQSNEVLLPGIHTWNVKAINSIGTTSSNESRSIFVDTMPPTNYNLLTPSDHSWTTSTQPTFTWAPSIDAHSGLAKYQLWIDGVLNRDNISSSATSTTPINILSNGSHTWEIRAVDNVGNFRNSNQIFTIKVDNKPPGSEDYYATISNSSHVFSSNNTNNYFNPQTQITIECWCKAQYLNTSGKFIILALNGYECGDDYLMYIKYVNSIYKVFFYLNGVGEISYNSSYAELTNNWNHFAGVYDGQNIKLYKNGIQVAISNVGQHNIFRNWGTNFKIGFNQCYGGVGNMFTGLIDEVRVWNYGRSAQEILSSYNSEIEPKTGLLAYWKFNQNFLMDFSNNGNTLNYASSTYFPSQILKTAQYLGNSNPLIYPGNYQFINTNLPFFTWNNAIDEGIGQKKYELFINGQSINSNIYDSTYQITNPLQYGFNYWRVNAYDSLDNNRPSVTRIFFVDNAPPNSFNLISPANNQGVMLPTPDLTWETTVDSLDGVGLGKYQLWLNGMVNIDSIPINVTTISPSNVLQQGIYTWFIRAYDKVGNCRQSMETRTFFVDWDAPSDFSTITPNDQDTISIAKPIFTWHPSFDQISGIQKYELNISGLTPIEVSPTDTSYLLDSGLPNGSYYWFVKAYDYSGYSSISNISSFFVNVPVPSSPNVIIGDTVLCQNSIETSFSIVEDNQVLITHWNIIPDTAGSMQNISNNQITIEWNSNYVGQVILSVYVSNHSGLSPIIQKEIIIKPLPSTPTEIFGSFEFCLDTAQTLNFSTNQIQNATSYQWFLPNGVMGSSNDSQIDLQFTNNSLSGDISVCGHNECGNGSVKSEFIKIKRPPHNIDYISGLDTVCLYSSEIYSFSNINDADEYIWTLRNDLNYSYIAYGMVDTTLPLSFFINYDYFVVNNNYFLSVQGVNECGINEVNYIKTIYIKGFPFVDENSLVGPSIVCNNETYTYTFIDIPNVDYYWYLPDGSLRITTSNSIDVDFTYYNTNSITVEVMNECGGIGLTKELLIKESSYSVIPMESCLNYTAPDGQVYNTSGIKTAIIPNAEGCDSIIDIFLNIKDPTYYSIYESVCDTYIAPDGQVYNTSGVKTAIIPNSVGCDSIITINLIVKQTTYSIDTTVCNSYIAPDDQVYTTSGTKTAIIPNVAGCDSVITINLIVNQINTSIIDTTACDSYTAPDGQIYTTSGTKTATFTNSVSCDSVITINLIVNQSNSSIIDTIVCDSYTAPDGQIYTTSGMKTAIIPNAAGCDSVITIHLTVYQSTSITINETVCDSYTAPDNQVYTTSGTKTAIIPNAAGCDSVITINLSVHQSTASTINATVCDSYTAPDEQIYTTSGTKTTIIPNVSGCDSTITINLIVNQSSSSTINATVCDSYIAPDGQIYYTSGTKTAIIPNNAGCDSTITINLTVNQSNSSTINATFCDSYTAADGQIYTTSGTKTAIISNVSGCDSTITINLTVNQNNSSTINASVCDTYTAPDGQNYTTSGTKTAILTNSLDCDSTITINLIVNQSSSSTINATVCDSYIAPDEQIYSTSGTKTAILTNSIGCDSVITINLTVKQSTSSTINATVCDTYTAPDGQIYTTSGTKTAIISNSAGCDSVITISLTINQSTSSTINATVCDSYTAPDGQIYTTSGTKTAILTNSVGCDSVITINLIVKQSTSNSINETVCDSYTAPDGQIYNTNGTKTAIIPNNAGCDSTITINLTVNQSSSSIINETVCDNYTAPDGQIYITSGTKTAIIPNNAGCDSTITINLTVNQSSSSIINETACNSYTAPDGQIYTTNGIQTAIIPNYTGCDSTITINLTVNQSTSGTINATVCDSYTAPDGQIYTTSGTKTAIIQNNAGCDSTITINLIVNYSHVTPTIILYFDRLISSSQDGNQWYNQNGLIPNETNQELILTENGTYFVIVTQNDCPSDSSNTILVNNVLVQKFDKNFIIINPNPFTDQLTIKNQSAVTFLYYMYNGVGQLILQGTLDTDVMLNTSDLAKGLYIIKFVNSLGQVYYKVVKQ